MPCTWSRTPAGHGPPNVLRRHAGEAEHRAPGAGPGLGQLLGGHHPERESDVDEVVGHPVGGGHAPVGERLEAGLPGVRHPLLEGGVGVPVVQVGSCHLVTRLAEPVGEGADPVGESLGMVEEEDVAHAGTLATGTDGRRDPVSR